MSKSMLFFLMLVQCSFGQKIKYLSENNDFKNGQKVFMFGDDVKLREQASTDAPVLSLLSIGEQVEILEKTNLTMVFDGIDTPWYKIKVKDKVGFVLGSFISLDVASIGAVSYYVALKKKGEKVFLKTRVLEGNQQYIETISQLSTRDFYIKADTNRGLETIRSIFGIYYVAESCGVDGGGIYLFYDGKSLHQAIKYSKVSDADAYWYSEDYYFPEDKEGVEGKIVYLREAGETKDYETEWVETIKVRRVLEWDGKEVHPKLKEE